MNLGLFSAVCLWLCNLFAELPPAKAFQQINMWQLHRCFSASPHLHSDCERINVYQDVCMDACVHVDLAQPSAEHSLVRFELLSRHMLFLAGVFAAPVAVIGKGYQMLRKFIARSKWKQTDLKQQCNVQNCSLSTRHTISWLWSICFQIDQSCVFNTEDR